MRAWTAVYNALKEWPDREFTNIDWAERTWRTVFVWNNTCLNHALTWGEWGEWGEMSEYYRGETRSSVAFTPVLIITKVSVRWHQECVIGSLGSRTALLTGVCQREWVSKREHKMRERSIAVERKLIWLHRLPPSLWWRRLTHVLQCRAPHRTRHYSLWHYQMTLNNSSRTPQWWIIILLYNLQAS